TLDIGIQKVNLVPTPPHTLKFAVQTSLKSESDLPVNITVIGLTSHCLIGIDTAKGPAGKQLITLPSDVDFTVDPTTHLTRLTALPQLFAPTKAKMDVLTVLGGYADITPMPTQGLSLGLLGGAMAAPHNPCVPKIEPGSLAAVDKWAEYTGEADPADGKTPYH